MVHSNDDPAFGAPTKNKFGFLITTLLFNYLLPQIR